MTPIRSMMPFLSKSIPHAFFSTGTKRVYFHSNHFMKFHTDFNCHQKRKFSRLPYFNSKDNTVNKIGKLSLSLIFGGIFLVSLFSYAKKMEVSFSSRDHLLSFAKIRDWRGLILN